jgi:hypothetical protein
VRYTRASIWSYQLESGEGLETLLYYALIIGSLLIAKGLLFRRCFEKRIQRYYEKHPSAENNSPIDSTILWGTRIEAVRMSLRVVVRAPIEEEFLYRGMVLLALIFGGFMYAIPLAMFTSWRFGLAHYKADPCGNDYYPKFVIWFFVMWGLLYCAATILTRSLWPVILAHALHNLLAVRERYESRRKLQEELMRAPE